jgi:uncharacterized protein (DUF1697 family)
MAMYVAFLRAINVGGHTVKAADIRAHFEALGHANVQTYLNSGNVSFDAEALPAGIETAIEAHLASALGYEVTTFVRSAGETAHIASMDLFPDAGADHDLYVAFLKRPLQTYEAADVVALTDEVFNVAVLDRQVYWSRDKTLGKPGQPGPEIEKTLRMPATVRGLRTVQRIAATLTSS